MITTHRTRVIHAGGDLVPLVVFAEVSEGYFERVIEIYRDGHTGISRLADMLELGGSMVPDQLCPSLAELYEMWGPYLTEISAEEFQAEFGFA